MIRTLQKNTFFHYPFVFDVLRVFFGAVLVYKGIEFLNSDLMELAVNNSANKGMAFILVHHVTFTLIVGGALIAFGLITRLAALFQLLLYVGMLVNANTDVGLYSVYQERIFAIFAIIISIFFVFYGSGYYSLDHYLKRRKT